ncbi:MAG TPA: hypothetical protein VLM11_17475 [Streptosporangiaceae bacterium]|nr:hypothetical protein [Streptosporangiaceae bacterium]
MSNTIPPTGPSSYIAEAIAQDGFLDEKLAAIRAHEDAGDITIREAAELRIAA